MATMNHCEVRITCGSSDEAVMLADALVAERLAACVHRSTVASVYEWEGHVEHDDEVLLTAITRIEHVDTIAEFVTARHSYELPAITSVPMAGTAAYLAWVDRQTAR
jgi:periplasmic divalent cation tolerance protein